MGQTKRLLEAIEEKRSKAIHIALRAKVLKSCEYHDEVFVGDQDIVGAYKLGNAIFEKESMGDTFETRREMTDSIKEAVDDAAIECPQCSRIRDL